MPDEVHYPIPDELDELSGHKLAQYVIDLAHKHKGVVHRSSKTRIYVRDDKGIRREKWGIRLVRNFYLTDHEGLGLSRRRFLLSETTAIHCAVLELAGDEVIRTIGRCIKDLIRKDEIQTRRDAAWVAEISATPATSA